LSQIKTLSRNAKTSMSQTPDTSIEQITRATQIIIGVLIAGVTSFLLIVVFLVHFVGFGAPAGAAGAPGQAAGANPAATAQSIPILTYLAAGMGAIFLPLSFILPGYIAAQNLRSGATRPADGSSNPSKYPAASPGQAITPAVAFQTSAIIGGALNEGPAFFAGIAYLIEQNPIALGVMLVLVAAMFVRIPTRGSVERWIEQQEEKLRSGSYG
jgi:hypothetical protein